MMKVGVLSDTHLASLKACIDFSAFLLAGPFRGVEAILHAGDLAIPDLENCFFPIPWYAVRGNMDVGNLNLPEKRVVELAGRKIGIIHGWGASGGIEERVVSAFCADPIDILIFGHSHQPICKKIGSLLIMNPGSPTDRRYAPYHSVGLLSLRPIISGEIINLDE